MLLCSFDDHLSVASLKCFYKGEQWTRRRNCPWNKSEHSQEARSALPGQEQDAGVRNQSQETKLSEQSRAYCKEEGKKMYTFFLQSRRLCRFFICSSLAMLTLQPPPASLLPSSLFASVQDWKWPISRNPSKHFCVELNSPLLSNTGLKEDSARKWKHRWLGVLRSGGLSCSFLIKAFGRCYHANLNLRWLRELHALQLKETLKINANEFNILTVYAQHIFYK